ncbi:MAG TPA: hypothetical protein VK711_11290 [Puia sp.]|nr:hypothetical protein [Puia sp.]
MILRVVRGDHAVPDNGGDCDDNYCNDDDRSRDGNACNYDACSNGDKDDDYDASEHEGLQRSSLI